MNFLKKIFKRNIRFFYMSEIDQFLIYLSRKFPKKSLSQREEISKFERIFRLRDRVVKAKKSTIWHKF